MMAMARDQAGAQVATRLAVRAVEMMLIVIGARARMMNSSSCLVRIINEVTKALATHNLSLQPTSGVEAQWRKEKKN